MVMRTAATDGVWANLKQSSETPGPIKPMDCSKSMNREKLWCCRVAVTCIIFRTNATEKPDLIRKSAEAPATAEILA
uniref:Uncharacterized protein n=1 Tax=Oryza meridionalis TaxID=40149 RepID=A0A0E0DSA2_9ORYZ